MTFDLPTGKENDEDNIRKYLDNFIFNRFLILINVMKYFLLVVFF